MIIYLFSFKLISMKKASKIICAGGAGYPVVKSLKDLYMKLIIINYVILSNQYTNFFIVNLINK